MIYRQPKATYLAKYLAFKFLNLILQHHLMTLLVLSVMIGFTSKSVEVVATFDIALHYPPRAVTKVQVDL